MGAEFGSLNAPWGPAASEVAKMGKHFGSSNAPSEFGTSEASKAGAEFGSLSVPERERERETRTGADRMILTRADTDKHRQTLQHPRKSGP